MGHQVPLLHCAVCTIDSHTDCPVRVKQGHTKPGRAKWGKSTTGKVKGKNGRNVTNITGEWCLTCMSVFRLRYQKKYKKSAGRSD